MAKRKGVLMTKHRKKKEEVPVPKPSTTLEVYLHKQLVEDYHSGERYGDWRRAYTNTFGSVTIRDDRESGRYWRGENVPVAFPVKPGDTVFVLWAEYSTGDSFGHETGTTDIITVFQHYETALKARDAIYAKVRGPEDPNWQTRSTIPLTMDGTKTVYPYYAPFMGYFERLDTLHISPATVEEQNDDDQ